MVVTQIWSHRGRVGPETTLVDNTVAAVSAAVDSGAEGVEIDTWRCSDGVFVLTHDRETPAGWVDRCRVGDLAHLDRLDDVLWVGGRGTLNIELKLPPESTPAEQARLGEALADDLGRAGAERLSVVVSSFSEDATRAVRASGLAVRVGHLCAEVPGPATLEQLAGLGYWGVHFLASAASLEHVGEISAAGLAAVAWTVNDPGMAAGLVERGVDVIITDVPVILLEAR